MPNIELVFLNQAVKEANEMWSLIKNSVKKTEEVSFFFNAQNQQNFISSSCFEIVI